MLGVATGVTACASGAAGTSVVHAVYQIDAGNEQASRALRYLRNHLKADPTAQLTVVALGSGIDFLLRDAVDEGGYPYELIVDDLVEQQVRFEVCGNTLETRGIAATRLIEHLAVVPSGMAEIARLQTQSHYAYIKP
jgi:hypothetical protein